MRQKYRGKVGAQEITKSTYQTFLCKAHRFAKLKKKVLRMVFRKIHAPAFGRHLTVAIRETEAKR